VTFVTGTGKSFLLSAIITHLKQRYAGDRYAVAVTASTGIASVHIDGCTIHSWSGVGIAQEPANKIAAKLMYQEKCAAAKTRWQRAEALILDESACECNRIFMVLRQA
jgi:ATP-dependent DNA helicase PIF1